MRTRLIAATAATAAGVLLFSACALDGGPGAPDSTSPSGMVSATALSSGKDPGGASTSEKVLDTASPSGKASGGPSPKGKASGTGSPSRKAEGAPAPPKKGPDARPDSQIPEADVPIAGVAPEAAGVNEPDPEQATGIRMSSDKNKGLDPTALSDTSLAGGCVPDYGTEGECLPPIPPRLAAKHAGHVGMDPLEMAMLYNCADVRALVPNGLATDEDPLGLDSNEDGIACGKGDDIR
jgi:hypothetical protein